MEVYSRLRHHHDYHDFDSVRETCAQIQNNNGSQFLFAWGLCNDYCLLFGYRFLIQVPCVSPLLQVCAKLHRSYQRMIVAWEMADRRDTHIPAASPYVLLVPVVPLMPLMPLSV